MVSCCNSYRDPVSVEYDEASAYAEENGLLFMETSAKTALNVNDIFLVWNHHNIGPSAIIVIHFRLSPRSCRRTARAGRGRAVAEPA